MGEAVAIDVQATRGNGQSSAGGGLVMSMLALDALALRVIAALEARDIPVLLMKGPVTAWWLFDGPLDHVYTDVDLLVAPSDAGPAGDVLRELGLIDYHSTVLGIYLPTYERAWVSPQGVVDLHAGLWGIPSQRAADAWTTFWRDAEAFELHGHTVRILDQRARLLQLALHAAALRSGEKARQDVRRGLAKVGTEHWRAASRLAHDLGAESEFIGGLVRTPEGTDLVHELALDGHRPSTLGVLYARGGSPEAIAVAQVAAQPRGRRWGVVRTWLRVERAEPTVPGLTLMRVKVLIRLPGAVTQWATAAARTTAAPRLRGRLRGRTRPGGRAPTPSGRS